MIGSPLVGSWVAHVAFGVLMALAVRHGRWRVLVAFAVLWMVGYIASGQNASFSLFFMPYVAVLDIALVFAVLHRDVRLT